MDLGMIAELGGQFGSMGLMIAYLIYRERAQMSERLESEKARIEADKALAQSLGALTAVVQGLDR